MFEIHGLIHRQADRQFNHYSITISTANKEYIQKVMWPSRKYILIETLTSPLPTKGPERVVLARLNYLMKDGITG